ncbi:MAG: hypothetical protein ACRDUW_01630 [Pseudonocardiaceae bacterium]
MENRSFSPGVVCWIDVCSTDPASSRDFYAGLFGWTYQIDPDRRRGYYTTALLDGRPVAGLAGVAVPAGQQVAWTLYLASANIDYTAEVITRSGGQVFSGPVDVPAGCSPAQIRAAPPSASGSPRGRGSSTRSTLGR